MANKVAAATGLWSAAATWNSVTNTPTIHATTNITISTSNLFTATFTAPNTTNACTGALIFINAVGSGGTVTVTLQESTVDTAAAVSIATTSLAAGTWVYFRFATPYVFTTTGAGAYRFRIVNALAAGTTSAAADSGAANIAYLATDDRTGVPGSTDNIWIAGQNQATAITVTLDGTQTIGAGTDTTLTNTTSTHTMRSLGWAMSIQNTGKLIWDTAADAYLTCRGTIAIGANAGEMDIGTVATPMPAARLGRLTMDVITTNGLYGIFVRDGGKFICQGAPKSSPTLWKTKYASGVGTAANPLIVADAVDWSVGDEIQILSTGTSATAYQETELRFIVTKNSATSYVLSTTAGGAEAALTYTHTVNAWILNLQRNVLIDAQNVARGWTFYNDSTVAGDVNFDWARFETTAGVTAQSFVALAATNGQIAMDYCVWYRGLSNRWLCEFLNSTIAHTFTGLIFTLGVGSGLNTGQFHLLMTINKTFIDCFSTRATGSGVTLTNAFNITFTSLVANANNQGDTSTCAGLIINASGGAFSAPEINANRSRGILLNTANKPVFTSGHIGNRGNNVIDVDISATTFNEALFTSCTFGSTTLIANYLTMLLGSEVKFHKANGTENNHFWYTPNGSARSTGAGLVDTNVRTAGTLNVRIAPEDSTTGFSWEFKILAKASSAVSVSGFIQKNAAFGSDVVTVSLFLPGSTTADATQTMPNDLTYDVFSLAANYTGTVDGLAIVRINAKTVAAAAYIYVADIYNGTNNITALKVWDEGKPASIMFEQLGDSAAVWAVLKSTQTTAGQMGYEITTDLDDIQTRLQTVDDLVDDLEGRLTATRAGYLDNLSAGAVALQGSVDDLEGRLTATRAGYLDNLSAGAVALQASVDDLEGRLTATRAGYLDNLSAGPVATQTSVDTIDDFLDTEIAAIKAKTDNLPSDPADESSIQATLMTIAGYIDTEVASILAAVDTEVAAIKAKTDNLPSDPADASDIATSFTTVNTKLDTIDDFLDSEVAAIKTKTDSLTFTVAGQVDANTLRIEGTDATDQIRDAILTDATRFAGASVAAILAAVDPEVATLITNVASILAAVDTEVAAIKAKTDNLPADPADESNILAAIAAISVPTAIAIADAVLKRGVSNTEATADVASLTELILAAFESSVSGTTWTVRKTGGTTFNTRTLTLDATALPIAGVT